MSLLLNSKTLGLHSQFFGKETELWTLFDRFTACSCFSVPEHEVTISPDNITFGPNYYTIFISQLLGSNFRIVYYCMLHYLFERDYNDSAQLLYQNLLHFIQEHNLELSNQSFSISDEEVKTYYFKFFYSLLQSRNKRKLIVDQLNILPQMDLLMMHLTQLIAGQQDLVLEINAREIQLNIKKQLGFQFQFLTNQLFIFQRQFIVEIRHYSENCSFFIRREKLEVVKEIKDNILMEQSAFFFHELNKELSGDKQQGLANIRKLKAGKKSTIKSIGLPQEEEEEELTKTGEWRFGGILDFDNQRQNDPNQATNVELSLEKNEQLTLEQFSSSLSNALIKAPEDIETVFMKCKIFQKRGKEDNMSSSYFQNKRNGSSTFNPQVAQSSQNSPKSSNQMHQSHLSSSSFRAVRSNTQSSPNLLERSDTLNLYGLKKRHKDSFPTSYKRFPHFPLSQFSSNIKSIKKPILQTKLKRPVRVPAFILDRERAKQKQRSSQNKDNTDWIMRKRGSKAIQIAFTYNRS